ncbi:MAG: dihydrodipicolinate synthase family protein, partial [Armatimonadetes bacterium]|nr:dihydrodipicolinate synthase family protein [Armatimonadota bacterium]
VFVRLHDAVGAGDLATARDLQLRVLPVIDALYRTPNPSGTKRLLELLGRPGGPVRAPLRSVKPDDDAHLVALLPAIAELEAAVAHTGAGGAAR